MYAREQLFQSATFAGKVLMNIITAVFFQIYLQPPQLYITYIFLTLPVEMSDIYQATKRTTNTVAMDTNAYGDLPLFVISAAKQLMAEYHICIQGLNPLCYSMCAFVISWHFCTNGGVL